MDELIERAVAEAVAAYRAAIVVPGGTAVLLLRVYYDGDSASQLAPPPLAVPRAGLPEFDGEEIGQLDVGDEGELRAMLDAIEYHEGDLLEEYLAALALALHREFGVVVLVDGLDMDYGAPVRDQLREQLSDAQWGEWEANGWLP